MATYTVTTDSDAAAPGDDLLSLREALALADADPGADTIDFAADLADRVIFLAQGQLTAASDVTIDGDDLDITINAGSASRVLLVEGGGTDMTLDSLTITGGQTTELSDSATGGGIHADAGTSLTLAGTAVIANSTAAGGGGIYAGGELTLTGSTVADNNVTGEETQGAGILANADVSLFQSAVTANFATGAGVQGGGIFAFGDVTLDASTVNGNEANGDGSYGGGIFGTGAVTLTNSTLAANSVSGTTGTGGGIFAGGIVSLTDSTLTSHYAALGGAIAARSVTTANSIVVGNFAASLAPGHSRRADHEQRAQSVRQRREGRRRRRSRERRRPVGVRGYPADRSDRGVGRRAGGEWRPDRDRGPARRRDQPGLGRGEPNDLDTDQRGEPRPPRAATRTSAPSSWSRRTGPSPARPAAKRCWAADSTRRCSASPPASSFMAGPGTICSTAGRAATGCSAAGAPTCSSAGPMRTGSSSRRPRTARRAGTTPFWISRATKATGSICGRWMHSRAGPATRNWNGSTPMPSPTGARCARRSSRGIP